MTTTATECPSWCTRDDRWDRTTDPNVHLDDFTTWHYGDAHPVEVVRRHVTTELRAFLYFFDPDHKEPDDCGPEIEIEGDDGSDFVCGLKLPVDAAERLALVMLDLVRAARA